MTRYPFEQRYHAIRKAELISSLRIVKSDRAIAEFDENPTKIALPDDKSKENYNDLWYFQVS